MTEEEVKRHQDELAEHYDLSHWYGTWCKKCCGVYPKLEFTVNHCWYECEVCGRRTEAKQMPWEARDAWNRDEVTGKAHQMTLF